MPQPPIDDATGSTIVHTGTDIVSGDTTTWQDLPLTGLRWNGIHREGDVVVTNIEQVNYAIALPLSWFAHDTDQNYPRGQQVFLSTDPTSHASVSVQGFIVDSEDEFTVQKKFERMQNDMRESGLTPRDGQVHESENYFVINGELPHLPDYMFTDIYFYFNCGSGTVFTDSVAIGLVYKKADEALWKAHSEFIQQNGVQRVCS